MHSLYSFHFLDTISAQLKETLLGLSVSPLTRQSLLEISEFQVHNRAWQGVYVLHYDNQPVYLGKAADVAERLAQHLKKLLGRQNINPSKIGYKSLLLDKSMSTAANESVLITLFRQTHSGMWNGTGFGPKDPGKERDGTEPSWFDAKFPIRLDIQIETLGLSETLLSLCGKMKAQLPYVFRFDLLDRGGVDIPLEGIAPLPVPLLQRIVEHLGPGWRAAVLSFGLVLYRNNKEYCHGQIIECRPSAE